MKFTDKCIQISRTNAGTLNKRIKTNEGKRENLVKLNKYLTIGCSLSFNCELNDAIIAEGVFQEEMLNIHSMNVHMKYSVLICAYSLKKLMNEICIYYVIVLWFD